MLDLEEGKKAVRFAREVIENYVGKKEIKLSDLGEKFSEKKGAFVTIHTYPQHDLRGCIGIPLPIMPLKESIYEAAISATRDPRFPPLSKEELDNIVVEVTILTRPEIIRVSNPAEYPSEIKIGRDGLIVEQGLYKGLLLPQVPVEEGWDEEEFLSYACIKAGLMPDAWIDKDTRIYRFSGQVFTELTPRGEIKEKKFNGR